MSIRANENADKEVSGRAGGKHTHFTANVEKRQLPKGMADWECINCNSEAKERGETHIFEKEKERRYLIRKGDVSLVVNKDLQHHGACQI